MSEAPPSPPHAGGAHPNDGAIIGAFVVVTIFLVVPMGFAIGGLAFLGACYDSCTEVRELTITLGFIAAGIGYVLLARWQLRDLRRARVRAVSEGRKVPYSGWGSAVALALAALFVAALIFVVTCFALLGVLSA